MRDHRAGLRDTHPPDPPSPPPHPELSKGLEFDLVVLVDQETFGEGIEGAVDHYVAMTQATQRMATLTTTA